jgi:hypothetical protein
MNCERKGGLPIEEKALAQEEKQGVYPEKTIWDV